MPRTDKEIADYMAFYSGTVDRQWALEHLARTEKTTVESICAICERFGVALKPPKYSKFGEETNAKVVHDYNSGKAPADIADKYGLPLSAVLGITTGHQARKKKAERKLSSAAEQEQRKPEAYPGQINDDEPEPVVESDVKVFIPGELPTDEVIELDVQQPEKIPYKKPEIIEPPIARACTTDDSNMIRPTLPLQNVWFAIRDELRDFALGIFGAGAEIVEESVSAKYHDVSIVVKTADGDHICFSVGKEKGKITEEDE